ncbi:hypothetical protein ACIQM4_34470 [Streptomyces sp. NPDC091272]|uniref:hypothetical protein n=1 Tax=Streptomyces sp. NPDC091272 TaxID=3365981 RepID=UPI00382A5EC7
MGKIFGRRENRDDDQARSIRLLEGLETVHSADRHGGRECDNSCDGLSDFESAALNVGGDLSVPEGHGYPRKGWGR